MIWQLSNRMLRTADKRCLWKLAYNFGYKGMRSVQKFKKRLKKGIHFPPFLYISIINSCNLTCQGCWVKVDGPMHTIDLANKRSEEKGDNKGRDAAQTAIEMIDVLKQVSAG